MSTEKEFIDHVTSFEGTFNHITINSITALDHINNNAGLVIQGEEGTAIITKSLRVPNTYFKWMNFDDGNQSDGRVFTSSADGTARWASKLFDTNDVPELSAGPSDNFINTFHDIGIGITNPTEKLHISTTTAGTGLRVGNLKLGVWSGSNDYSYLIHNDLKLEDASYGLRLQNTGEVAVNSKNTLSFKINDVEGVTILNHSESSLIRVGIGTQDPGTMLHVADDVRIGGNLYVDGATVLVQSEVVTIADALVRFGANNPGNTKDLGFYGQYVDVGVTKFSGLFINHADSNMFHLFRDLTVEPNTSGTIDTSSSSGYDLGDLKLGFVHCDDGVIVMGEDSRIKYGPNTLLRFTTDDGLDKIFFSNNGKIGVGVTYPGADIQVSGTITSNDFIGIGVTSCDVSFDTDKTDAHRVPVGTLAQRPTGKDGLIRYNNDYFQFETYSNGAWQSISGLIDTDRDTYILAERLPTNADEDILWFYTSGLPRMVVHSSGNIGLNEIAPTIMLEVNSSDGILIPTGTTAERPSGRKGIVRYNSQLERYEGYGAGDAWGSLGGVVDIDQDTYITAERLGILDEDHLWMYTKGDLRMIIRDNGNIGIGVTSPSYPLELFPDTDSKALLGRAHIGYLGHTDHASFSHKDVSNSTSYALSQSNDGHTWINSANEKNIEFLQNNQRKAIIKSGNVGINIDVPSEKLEVGGNIRISDTFHIATNEIRARETSGTLVVSTDMTINGDFIVNGTTTTVNTTNITVDDPLIHLASNNTATDTADIGFYGSYPYDGSTEYTGLFRDSSSSDYRYKLFTQLGVAPSATNIVNTSGAGYTKGTLELGLIDTETIDYPVNLSFRDSTSGVSHITFATNGYVGISSTSPSVPFHVNKTNTGSWSAKITNGYANVLIANESGYGMSINSGVDVSNNGNYCLQCRTDFTTSGNTTPYLFTVLNNGFCGINVSNPLDQLHIQGIYQGDGARINCVKVGSWINGSEYNSDAIFAHTNFGTAAYNTTDSFGYAIRQTSLGDTYLNAKQGREIDFRIDDSRIAGIASTGYMGIGAGITAPESLLHVGGSVLIEGNILLQGELKYTGPAATDLKIQDTVIMLASENNGDAFDIGFFGMYIYDSESEYTGLFRDATDKKWKLFSGLVDNPGGPNTIDTESMGFTPDTLVLGDVEAQNVYTNLKMGIGVTQPSVALHIEKTDAIKIPKGTTAERPTATSSDHMGYIRYNSQLNLFEGFGAGNAWNTLGGVTDVDQDTYISAEDSAGNDNDQLKFITANTQRMIVTSTGLVGINSSSPSQYLDVNGNVQCISYITISDKRVKKDINLLSSSTCLNNILNIPVYEYRFKDTYRNSCKLRDKKRYGPLAQEVEKQIPDAVETSDKRFVDTMSGQFIHIEDFKSIDNNALIAQLIGSIQALTNAHVKSTEKFQKEISQLKERISVLENN